MKKKDEVLVQLDVLGNRHGHKPQKLTITDDTPERRKEIAEDVVSMIKKGTVVQLADGTKVCGYDPETNSWLVPLGDGKKGTKKVDAKGKKAVATPLPVGG